MSLLIGVPREVFPGEKRVATVPEVVATVIWAWMLDSSFGVISWGLIRLGLITQPIQFTTDSTAAFLAVSFVMIWKGYPMMAIMLLAGLQAIPEEQYQAAKVDGANGWQSFWHVTFPLMLPVSLTVLIIRIIFKLKLADIVINVTAGGPGGATDTVSSFIYREYRDRSNVGYGTMLAMFYLVLIIVFVTVLLNFANKRVRRVN